MDKYVETNGIRLHYLDHPGEGPTLILMPGLTANAHSFAGLVKGGLAPALHVLALDLRGRGEFGIYFDIVDIPCNRGVISLLQRKSVDLRQPKEIGPLSHQPLVLSNCYSLGRTESLESDADLLVIGECRPKRLTGRARNDGSF